MILSPKGRCCRLLAFRALLLNCFAVLVWAIRWKLKQLQKGLTQLSEEGATQFFRPLMSNDLILGAVGMLQFDVVAHRLKNEYGVDATF